MNLVDTIAAISTPPGTGAIAMVRMTGNEAWSIARRIFTGARKSGSEDRPWASSSAMHGFLRDPDVTSDIVDEVVLTPFKAPHTYTGEDLVEISCHGGAVVTREILNLCLRTGARLARPGEFTQRAFLNGRMDLVQAEAVFDLIHSKTSRQSRLALSALSGELGKQIHRTRTELVELLTGVNAGIDFPEEVGDVPLDHAEETVRRSISALDKLASTTRSGRFLREGLRLAIVGKPNAGKSSLLNRLLNFERAIVTDIPGTTRDALEELLDINGIPVILTDTAGIRETNDRVEQIGIERSKRAVDESDLVLFVTDLHSAWDADDARILQMIENKEFVALGNKIDLIEANETNDVTASFIRETKTAMSHMSISARNGDNMDALCAWIERWALGGQDLREAGGSLNVRQGELCVKSIQSLKLVLQTIESGLPQDCLATDLKCAIDSLSEVCGEVVSEEIIANVFASFCIGK